MKIAFKVIWSAVITFVADMSWFAVWLQDITGWGENDRGVSFTFGGDVVRQFLKKHGFSLIARAHQVSTAIVSCVIVSVTLRVMACDHLVVFYWAFRKKYQHQ